MGRQKPRRSGRTIRRTKKAQLNAPRSTTQPGAPLPEPQLPHGDTQPQADESGSDADAPHEPESSDAIAFDQAAKPVNRHESDAPGRSVGTDSAHQFEPVESIATDQAETSDSDVDAEHEVEPVDGNTTHQAADSAAVNELGVPDQDAGTDTAHRSEPLEAMATDQAEQSESDLDAENEVESGDTIVTDQAEDSVAPHELVAPDQNTETDTMHQFEHAGAIVSDSVAVSLNFDKPVVPDDKSNQSTQLDDEQKNALARLAERLGYEYDPDSSSIVEYESRTTMPIANDSHGTAMTALKRWIFPPSHVNPRNTEAASEVPPSPDAVPTSGRMYHPIRGLYRDDYYGGVESPGCMAILPFGEEIEMAQLYPFTPIRKG